MLFTKKDEKDSRRIVAHVQVSFVPDMWTSAMSVSRESCPKTV